MTPACEALYSGSMIAGSTSALSLAQICAGLPAPRVADLGLDQLGDALAQVDRRHRDLFEAGRAGIAGHEIEQPGGVAAQRRVAGEERQVGVDLGGIRVVVAGAEMHVGAQLAALAPHHQRHLGVRLQLQEAVDHLHAGALQLARPADIGLFVEARLQFDHRGDRFAGFGRLDQARLTIGLSSLVR